MFKLMMLLDQLFGFASVNAKEMNGKDAYQRLVKKFKTIRNRYRLTRIEEDFARAADDLFGREANVNIEAELIPCSNTNLEAKLGLMAQAELFEFNQDRMLKKDKLFASNRLIEKLRTRFSCGNKSRSDPGDYSSVLKSHGNLTYPLMPISLTE
ncbi:hypothetical protein [Thalassotalea sp. PS06]|uniref:hypothetical protein n=1 Tax=Thalassotalea sp. PS06 TaxID=2594005 RepID=UPI0011642299|nr:hypothetical protein [Thalassotalea sp. PS06]QDP02308.1 hypothetical protein FNC98_13720 [Thalassotalea sp. PS06]